MMLTPERKREIEAVLARELPYDVGLSHAALALRNEIIRDLLAELPEWRPIETAPRAGVVVRWHKVWNCPVAVERNLGRLSEALEWITACKSNSWPEEAFTPYWQPLPEPPSHG